MKTNRSLSIYLLNFLTAPIATQPSFSNTKILLSRLHLRKHQTLHRVRSLYARHCRWSNRIKIENRDVEVKRHTKKRRLGGWIKEIPFWWFIPHDVQSPFVWINYPTLSARTMTTTELMICCECHFAQSEYNMISEFYGLGSVGKAKHLIRSVAV